MQIIHFADQINIKLISQLIRVISRVPQKVLKYLKGATIYTYLNLHFWYALIFLRMAYLHGLVNSSVTLPQEELFFVEFIGKFLSPYLLNI